VKASLYIPKTMITLKWCDGRLSARKSM